jgi:hypothetical protein
VERSLLPTDCPQHGGANDEIADSAINEAEITHDKIGVQAAGLQETCRDYSGPEGGNSRWVIRHFAAAARPATWHIADGDFARCAGLRTSGESYGNKRRLILGIASRTGPAPYQPAASGNGGSAPRGMPQTAQ